MKRTSLAAFGLCILLAAAPGAVAQNSAAAQGNSAVAQANNDRIDRYFGDWHNAAPRTTHGALVERDILTRGNNLNPPKKGATLRYVESYTYATLAPGKSTTATRLTGSQEIYFVASGSGVITAGGASSDLHRNVAVLVPANLEYTLKSTGSEPLAMYLIREPIPDGFRPNAGLLVRDANTLPITSTESHWAHIDKPIFTTVDGLGTLESVVLEAFDPITIGQPHNNGDHPDIEEVWQSLTGTSLAFVGNRLIRQSPGMAFMHIPDGKTPHTYINYSEDTQDTFLYFARYSAHEDRK